MRGVAALLIVLRHTESYFFPYGFQESYLAVDLFFLMSGVVICHSYENRLLEGLSPLRFSWMRIIRIYPLYLLGCTISVITLLCDPAQPLDPRHIIYYIGLALFMLPSMGADLYPLNGPTWSLFFELVTNFFYGFFTKRLTTPILVKIVAASALLMIPVIALAKSHSLNIGFWMSSFPTGAVRVTFSFFMGVIVYRVYRAQPEVVTGRLANLKAWGTLAFVTLFLTIPTPRMLQSAYDWLDVILVFPVLVYCSLCFVLSGFTDRVFKFLGIVSYAIYVLHAPLSGAISVLMTWKGIPLTYGAPVSGLLFLAGLIPLCYVVDMVFDAPVRRYLLSLNKPRLNEQAVASRRPS